MAILNDEWETEVYLGLGSNKGNGIDNLSRARELIAIKAGVLLKVSSAYETEPWGNEELNSFYNQVVQIKTNYSPMRLLGICQSIEKKMGRRVRKSDKYENRVIDIDILFYGNHSFQKNKLLLPHPHLAERNFVLMPMAEIAGGLIHPALNRSIDELLKLSKDNKKVKKLG